jgi:hypothetical protein
MRYDEPRLVWTGLPITHFGTREEPGNLTQGSPVSPGHYYSAYYKSCSRLLLQLRSCSRGARGSRGARLPQTDRQTQDRHKTDIGQTQDCQR